jgi:hypothetical protein
MVGPFFNLKADPVPQKNFQDKGKKKKSSKIENTPSMNQKSTQKTSLRLRR